MQGSVTFPGAVARGDGVGCTRGGDLSAFNRSGGRVFIAQCATAPEMLHPGVTALPLCIFRACGMQFRSGTCSGARLNVRAAREAERVGWEDESETHHR